ncbi:MAG TPA: primosomal protein N' [Gemmatimonadaceae bacterium]|nr:primosomal protein N' [Gemmatimonadaceae bacterium]
MPDPHPLIEVALPLPLFRTFTYSVDGETRNPLVPGTRVVVPLRTGREVGIYLGPSDGAALKGGKAKAILDVPDAAPALSESALALGRWVAEYYVVPLGVALRCALPVALTGAATPTPARKTRRIVTIRRHLPSLLHRDRIFARAPQQRALFELIESVGGRSPVEHLLDQLSFSPSVLKGLVARGLVEIGDEVVSRDPFVGRDGTAHDAAARHAPTPRQRSAIDAMSAGAPGEVFLLHGITGSGKTLVYIELLREIVGRRGKSAIVLVPEIALTPQTVDRFRSVFGDQIAVLHSALSDGERYDAWLALRNGEKRIAVGARSAVFAPLENLGAIIVDEEHESSYKQGETPRYHARETAIVRARNEGAVVVLGSATPSLESWTNAKSGKYRLLELPERVGGGSLPTVEVVDMRTASAARRAASGARSVLPTVPAAPRDLSQGPLAAARAALPATDAYGSVFSAPLDAALADRITKGEQSILLLNRRGYASFVQCGDCGDVATCPNCSITLTYHRAPERLVCHYCLHQDPPRTACPRCKGTMLKQRGLGTQQVERLLSERFPAARIARMDVDTTSGKWAHAEILDRVGRREVDVLLGTQMIAKGLDFPDVTLVGVIDADVGINLPDFRASERCYQLLAQVAGRAGRGPKGGRVLIQTRSPGHHAVRCAVSHDYEAFVREEYAGREHPPYPPIVRIANVVFSGVTEASVEQLAQRGAEWIGRLLGHASGVTMIGPAPCPVEKIKNRWRWHVLLKAEHPGELTRVARYFLERFEIPKAGQLRVTVDRDPVALL